LPASTTDGNSTYAVISGLRSAAVKRFPVVIAPVLIRRVSLAVFRIKS